LTRLLGISAVILVCLVAGAAFGRYVLTLPPEKIIVRERVPQKKASETVFLKWKMASSFPAELPQFGTLGKRFTEQLQRVSNGGIRIAFEAPGKVVPAVQCLNAVVQGKVQACWSTPGFWARKERALLLFSGFPFGFNAREYLAWYYHAGGKELLDEIYARHHLKAVVCGVTTAEAGGWFRKEINTPDDFKNLRLRFFGLGARVVERLGAKTFRLRGDKMIEALKTGKIDGLEYSTPVIDVSAGFHDITKNFYLPGWQKPAALLVFLVKRDTWTSLPAATRALIETTCGDTLRAGLARGEARQPAALREIKAKGATIHRWSPEILAALSKAWQQVAKEESEADPTFRKVWQSMTAFKSAYAEWKRDSRMP
jgi:TRAP-type mannitol/chloroaromatic compound transport system substrate-binding protein